MERMLVDDDLPSRPPVFVRSVDGESKLSVRLCHPGPDGDPRPFNFLRDKSEPWERFSQRLVHSLATGRKKKGQKRKAEASFDGPGVSLLSSDGAEVQGSATADSAFLPGSVLTVGARRYRVRRNAPSVSSLRIVRRPLLHCPLAADVETEFCAVSALRWAWAVCPGPETPGEDAAGWTTVHDGSVFTLTSPDHAGQWLKVTATPCDDAGLPVGLPLSTISKLAIMAGPTLTSPLLSRLDACRERVGPGQLRVLSYNLLADLYADSDHSRDHLYPYCPSDCLEAGYRRQLALWEIQRYNADLLCLQEVDEAFFRTWLSPVMKEQGFDGRLLLKKNVAEGVAIFYRTEKLLLVEDASLPVITDALNEFNDEQMMKETAAAVANNTKFAQRWAALRQCLLGLVLRRRDDENARPILVATTHLYFHPVADHIRLLQAVVCLKHLDRVRARLGDCGLVFAGDLNTDPRNAVYEMATLGRLRSKVADWYSSGREEFFGSPELTFAKRLTSAYDVRELVVTNYVSGFRGILDYIFYDAEAMELVRAVPLSSVDDIQAYVALPNPVFPSDHLALVVDLRLL